MPDFIVQTLDSFCRRLNPNLRPMTEFEFDSETSFSEEKTYEIGEMVYFQFGGEIIIGHFLEMVENGYGDSCLIKFITIDKATNEMKDITTLHKQHLLWIFEDQELIQSFSD